MGATYQPPAGLFVGYLFVSSRSLAMGPHGPTLSAHATPCIVIAALARPTKRSRLD